MCCISSGGYGIQPNSDILLKALTDSGFLIDSSVVPGFVFKGSVNQIDFSNVPVMANYYLDHDVNTPSQKNQGIFEIPIASCEFGHWENSFLRFKFFMQKFLKNNFSSEKSMNSKEKGYPIQHKTTMQTENITNISRYNLFFRNSYNEVLYEKFMYLDLRGIQNQCSYVQKNT